MPPVAAGTQPLFSVSATYLCAGVQHRHAPCHPCVADAAVQPKHSCTHSWHRLCKQPALPQQTVCHSSVQQTRRQDMLLCSMQPKCNHAHDLPTECPSILHHPAAVDTSCTALQPLQRACGAAAGNPHHQQRHCCCDWSNTLAASTAAAHDSASSTFISPPAPSRCCSLSCSCMSEVHSVRLSRSSCMISVLSL